MHLSENARKVYKAKLKEWNTRLSELKEAQNRIYMEEDGYEERNFALTSIVDEIQFVSGQIRRIEEALGTATDVQRQSKIDDTVDIGDHVTIMYEDDEEPFTFRLTSARMQEGDVSLDSPLGKSVYRKQLGDTIEYNVNKNNFKAKIIGLVNEQQAEEEQEPQA